MKEGWVTMDYLGYNHASNFVIQFPTLPLDTPARDERPTERIKALEMAPAVWPFGFGTGA